MVSLLKLHLGSKAKASIVLSSSGTGSCKASSGSKQVLLGTLRIEAVHLRVLILLLVEG